MDRPQRPIGRRIAIAAIALLGLAVVAWSVLPNGKLARIERRAACYDPAALPKVETLADGRKAIRLRVLLWNVEGLPWPIRTGREARLARIADWIAARRAEGKGPDILILHKAFIPEASRISLAGNYRSIMPGPDRDIARVTPAATAPEGFHGSAHWWKGEAVGKWLDSGLYIATDLPVVAARVEAFGHDSCGGYDCLANKGGLALRIALPGAPEPLILFNTHRNSREPAGVPIARAEAAHLLQTRENDRMLADFDIGNRPAMIAAGDFNNYRAGDRSGRFASDPAFRLAGKAAGFAARAAPMTDPAAWRQAYDLLGYRSGDRLDVAPVSVATLFDGKNGPRLSDHDAQYVVFRINWPNGAKPMPVPVPPCHI